METDNASSIPAGLEILYAACRDFYPDQPNPMQFNAIVKYWLGGPDPLDYISLYHNKGDSSKGIPPHWHYISFGLSDLHGDGRVHDPTGPGSPSGYGYELTIRVKCKENETSPPTWPASLMQGLASYIHKRDACLKAGDHVTWHTSLNQTSLGMRHMLIVNDPILPMVQTPFGTVEFLQIFGILHTELKAVQKWNGVSVIDVMKKFPELTGTLFITDIDRKCDLYSYDPRVVEEIENGLVMDGSSLSGVSAKIIVQKYDFDIMNSPVVPMNELSLLSSSNAGTIDDLNNKNSNPDVSLSLTSKPKEHSLDHLHLILNMEAGTLIPTALRGRLAHQRHFTFQSLVTNLGVTLVPPDMDGSFVSTDNPYKIVLNWLQVLINDDLLGKMINDCKCLEDEEVVLPQTFEWAKEKLKITVVNDDTQFV